MQLGNLLLHNLQLCNLRLCKAHVTDTIAVIRERHYETQRSRATIQDTIRNHLHRLECEIKVARAMHGLCGRCLPLRAVTLAYSTLTVAVISKRHYEFPLSRALPETVATFHHHLARDAVIMEPCFTSRPAPRPPRRH
jgi:hypothetical protein